MMLTGQFERKKFAAGPRLVGQFQIFACALSCLKNAAFSCPNHLIGLQAPSATQLRDCRVA